MFRIFATFRLLRNIHWNHASLLLCATPFLLLCIVTLQLKAIFEHQNGYVVANAQVCADIGQSILDKEGSVVDAAIATMLCEGVILPNRAGIGGGFTSLMFIKSNIDSLTATPIVPEKFQSGYLNKDNIGFGDAITSGVPGELRGYWDLHQKYGLLPWKSLFEPAIKICETGIPEDEWRNQDLQRSVYTISSKAMREMYKTLSEQSENGVFKYKKLAKTLKEIAKNGINTFYNGTIGDDFIDDVRKGGGIFTKKDLWNYKSKWEIETISIRLPRNRRAFTTPLPSKAAMVAFVLNIVKLVEDKTSNLFWHYTIEAMKYAAGLSFSFSDIENEPDEVKRQEVNEAYKKMIDPFYARMIYHSIREGITYKNIKEYEAKFYPTQTPGSSNICIISSSGDAIVMTSSLMWDSKTFFYSNKTGIILNNMMRSFIPKVIKNLKAPLSSYVRPGKRTLISHSPLIIINQPRARVDFIVGASGSYMIPSQVIKAIIDYCFFNQPAAYAANSGFFYPDLLTNTVNVIDPVIKEAEFDKDLMDYLNSSGHTLKNYDVHDYYTIRTCIGNSRVSPDMDYTYRERGGLAIARALDKRNSFITFFLIVFIIGLTGILAYEVLIYE